MEPLLELKNISHAYHTRGGETTALSNLSFQVFPGEFLRPHRSQRVWKNNCFIHHRRLDPGGIR